LRREQGARRSQVPPEVREQAGRAVAQHVVEESRLRSVVRIALYAALPDELPTRPVFEVLQAQGRRCLLPRVRGRELEFVPVTDWDELVPARLGILTPPEERPAEVLCPEDAVLLPGLAFDAAGRRLGRGGGFYDRAFADRSRSPALIGVAYALQVVAEVPVGSRDRSVDAIVTERGLRWLQESA
jgi:5-formyltetrahydrofolate cyclo-ligase